MNLSKIVRELRNFPGISRKGIIHSMIAYFPVPNERVIASFGEDAAVIDMGSHALLLAADGIWEGVMNEDPYWAGYCSILVNINDIVAMGGKPLAALDVMSIKDADTCKLLAAGLRDGIEKFGVPIVGGHIHPGCSYNAVDVSILGIVEKGSIIFSHTAEVGDDIIFGVDLNGRLHPRSNISWDTTSFKPPSVVREQLAKMNEIGKRHLVTAGKDISNPGCLGTIGMLLETSGRGAVVDLQRIPIPGEMPLLHWLKVYPGCGFVVTCKPRNSRKTKELFEEAGLSASVVGKVEDGHLMKITDGLETKVLFDFERDKITGIHAPEPRAHAP